jgi:tRNA(adenine34) deaminase
MPINFPDPMRQALDLASSAALAGEVPVGAVIMRDGECIAFAANAMRTGNDPTAHAEISAIRLAAAKLGSQRLAECDLWVTLEPCSMCAGAILHARIKRLYYAASDPKGGAIENGPRLFTQPDCLHRPEIYAGIGEAEARKQLQTFFLARRAPPRTIA